jgi:hypothetical protein
MPGVQQSGGRFFGYTPDAPEKRTQKDVRALLAKMGSTALPSAVSYRSNEAPILDQGQTGSCTGHGTAQGIVIGSALQGVPLSFVPSPLTTYGVTRSMERAVNTVPLTDSGAMPSDVMIAVGRYGIRAMQGPTPDGRNSDIWSAVDVAGIPNAPAPNVNSEVDFLSLEQAGQKLIVGEYRIDESSSDVVSLVQQCLAVAKAPVGIGIFVDSQVMNFTSTSAPVGSPNTSDPNGGGHWICIVGYRPSTVNPGTVDWEICNSWGAGYGDAGHFWAQQSWIQSATDLYGWTVRSST